jgi:hypothetical protein
MEPTWGQAASLVLHVAMGVSLAACAGLRAFLPLLVVGAAGRLDLLPLTRSFEWLESWPALIVFGVAVLAEFLADKFPVVDHFLDSVQVFVKPVAGTILMASVLSDLTPLQATVLGLIAGGTAAGAVHVGKAKLRLVSSVTTAGTANPAVSFLEDVIALLGTLASLIAPLLMLLLLILAAVLGWMAFRHWRRGRAAARETR